jgi:hypothetical protein
VFIDRIWVVSMAFTLPLAGAAATLSKSCPTLSLFGPHTISRFCGVFKHQLSMYGDCTGFDGTPGLVPMPQVVRYTSDIDTLKCIT